jgi:hypothetical protein
MPNPGSNQQYEAVHLDASHGTEPFKIVIPGSNLEPAYLVGAWYAGSGDCFVTFFDGHPSEDYALGEPVNIGAGGRLDLGSPGFPLTGSGLWVAVADVIPGRGKLHVFVR